MNQIKDAKSKMDDLKILINNAIVIHSFNNLDSQFGPYLTILNHEVRQKEKLPILSELIKSLEDKELRFKNKGTTSTNFAKKSKLKLASHEKKSDRDLNQKKEDCKIFRRSYSGKY